MTLRLDLRVEDKNDYIIQLHMTETNGNLRSFQTVQGGKDRNANIGGKNSPSCRQLCLNDRGRHTGRQSVILILTQ